MEYDETFSITLTVDNPLDTINGSNTAQADVTIVDNNGVFLFVTELYHITLIIPTAVSITPQEATILEDFSSFPLCGSVDVQGGLERPMGLNFIGSFMGK